MATAYINGRIYTVEPETPWVEALLIEGGVFTAVGTNQQIYAESTRPD